MEAYQQRVVEEKTALDEKIEKLSAFVGTERFCSLPEAEQIRLTRQRNVMVEYSGILGERIAAFKRTGRIEAFFLRPNTKGEAPQ